MKFIGFLFLSLLGATVFGQDTNPEITNDPLRKKLNGSVRTIKHEVTPDQFEETGADSTQLRKMVVMDSKGRESQKVSFEYNNKNELVSRRVQSNSSEEGYVSTFEYYQGKMIKQIISDAKGNVNNRFSYRYDKQGNKTEEVTEIPSLQSTARYQKKMFEYDKQNRLVKESERKENNELVSMRAFTYDTHNNLKEIVTTHATASPYDNVKKYSYDDRNNLTAVITDYKDDTLDDRVTYVYTFDAADNVVAKSVFSKGEVIYEMKRQIIYR